MASRLWPMEHGWHAAYTEDHNAYRDAMTIGPVMHMATHSLHRREFAWQVRFPSRVCGAVERCLCSARSEINCP